MNIKFFLLVCISVCCLTACKEEDDIVGKNIQPDSDNLMLHFVDTATLYAFSLKDDSIKTDEMNMNLLGYISDPIFGKTKADIYSQFRLSDNSLDFGDGAQIDSIVLTLSYDGFFGDTLKPFIIKVFELDEGLDIDKTYYSSSTLAYKSSNLTDAGTYYCNPRPKTIDESDSGQTTPVLRIPLKKSFGTSKFIDKSGSTELTNNDNFLAYFKGLLIQAEAVNEAGSIIYVDMLDAASCLTVYYRNNQKTNLKYSFVVNELAERFTSLNHYNYTDANTSLKKQLIDKDYTEIEEKLFVQASGGVQTLIHFPFLKSMFEGKKVIITKAELVITRLGDDYTCFYQPPALDLYYKKDESASTSYYLPDYSIGTDYFGGTYNTIGNEYRFRITQYIQRLVLGSVENYPLHLVVKGASTKANRMMFYGTNPASYDNRLRLEITYSLINK